MTDKQHPITPPPELRRLWAQQAQRMDPCDPVAWQEHVANQAARWGADQELEACCDYMQREDFHGFAKELRAARRSKPPRLAEEALEEIQQMEGAMYSAELGCDFTATRAALERLQHLEQESNDN